jgi:hypothetical protein
MALAATLGWLPSTFQAKNRITSRMCSTLKPKTDIAVLRSRFGHGHQDREWSHPYPWEAAKGRHRRPAGDGAKPERSIPALKFSVPESLYCGSFFVNKEEACPILVGNSCNPRLCLPVSRKRQPHRPARRKARAGAVLRHRAGVLGKDLDLVAVWLEGAGTSHRPPLPRRSRRFRCRG